MRRAGPLCAVLASGLFLASTLPPGVSAEPAARDRFEVLQAAVFGFGAPSATHQGLDNRTVLFEHHVGTGGPLNENASQAAIALLNETPPGTVAYAQFLAPHARFTQYYGSEIVPVARFDGLFAEFGGGPQTLGHLRSSYSASRARAPDASINLSGALVIDRGFLDYEVFSPLDLTGSAVTLRVLLVEDPAAPPPGGGERRFLVREYLSGVRLALEGNASFSGRINFTADPSWVESRLFAIAFVQVDSPPPVERAPRAAPLDFLTAVIAPLAVLATGATMAVMVLRFVSAERRSRLR